MDSMKTRAPRNNQGSPKVAGRSNTLFLGSLGNYCVCASCCSLSTSSTRTVSVSPSAVYRLVSRSGRCIAMHCYAVPGSFRPSGIAVVWASCTELTPTSSCCSLAGRTFTTTLWSHAPVAAAFLRMLRNASRAFRAGTGTSGPQSVTCLSGLSHHIYMGRYRYRVLHTSPDVVPLFHQLVEVAHAGRRCAPLGVYWSALFLRLGDLKSCGIGSVDC